MVNYRTGEETARQTMKQIENVGGKGVLVKADLTLSDDRQRLIETTLAEFGHLDMLVNNAGMGPRERVDILEMGEESFDEVMDTNLKGPFFLTQRIARIMLDQVMAGTFKSPKIINIGSISAYASSLNRAEYCISKAGVAMMTLLFADRLSEAGINVYEIRPGIIRTEMTKKAQAKYDRLIENGVTPLKRWGEPEDVARAVVAIAEGSFPFSTGETINVDGGFHISRL